MSRTARALVVTVVHHPEDARIRHRQIDALLAAGWEVTYAAPFSGYGLPVVSTHPRLGVLVHVPHDRRQVQPAQGEQQLRIVQEYDVVPGAARLEQRARRPERRDP